MTEKKSVRLIECDIMVLFLSQKLLVCKVIFWIGFAIL